MNWTLPGTILTIDKERPGAAEELLSNMTVTGGLVLSQVCQITGLEPYIIQNWVKRGFLAPPEKKKYTLRQLSRIIIINMLKGAMPMDAICRLLSYVNGVLDDESDDIIDDKVMYLIFVDLARKLDSWPRIDLEGEIRSLLVGYEEPCPGANDRITAAIRVMATAWYASELQKQAGAQLAQLPLKGVEKS